MPYERKELYSPEEVLSKLDKDRHVFDGDEIKMQSLRYHVFSRSLSCSGCGLLGTYFAKERQVTWKGDVLNSGRFHFNLYGVTPDGLEILFTKDHILPSSKGGTDSLSNLQTMCLTCNLAKADKVD